MLSLTPTPTLTLSLKSHQVDSAAAIAATVIVAVLALLCTTIVFSLLPRMGLQSFVRLGGEVRDRWVGVRVRAKARVWVRNRSWP